MSFAENSEWVMPAPATMRSTSPGRTRAWLPIESRCVIAPSNSQDTVASPVCGWRATRIPSVAETSSGPKWSTKHQAPMREVRRAGSVRCTVMPRGPPSGTSRGASSTKSSKVVMVRV